MELICKSIFLPLKVQPLTLPTAGKYFSLLSFYKYFASTHYCPQYFQPTIPQREEKTCFLTVQATLLESLRRNIHHCNIKESKNIENGREIIINVTCL